jgi:hypothetical protein
MKKLLIAPLIALAGIAPATLPALAQQSVPYCTGGENISQDAEQIELQLRGNGHDVTNVEEWNGCIRAYVTDNDGDEHMVFFDPETLQQIG